MPVYFNSKNLLTIPRDDESDISENEVYLEDPDMLFDRLPQPFRLINKIVNKICNDAWSCIVQLNKSREEALLQRYVDSVHSIDRLQEEGNIQCMCVIENNQVLMGLSDGVTVWSVDGDKQVVLDKWQDDSMNITSMTAYRFCENVNLVAIINEDGSARLLATILGRIYSIREFPGSKDGEKPNQVTNIVMDNNCSTICLSYAQMNSGSEHWLEVSRINREAWTKEIGMASKGYQEYLNSQSSGSIDVNTVVETSSSETTAILDRSAVRVTSTNIIMKMKFPDTGAVLAVGNIHQLSKQVDILGTCVGLGLNHCITKNVIDARVKASGTENNIYSSLETHLMRIANVRYLKTVGSLIPETSNEDNLDKEYSMIAVWWSQSQHLLMYGLNKSLQKDPLVKPDGVRSFSCPISACELSPNTALICVGLQNGILSIIDVNSGLTRLIKKVSNYPIKAIHFLHYKDSGTCQYINVIDDKHSMFCVKYNVSLAIDNGEIAIVDSDMDVDNMVTICGPYDLVLSVSRQGPLVLKDMFSGTAILKIELPMDTFVASPWQPILACFADNYLCIQALTNVGIDEDEYQPATLLYKLDLDQFKYEDNTHQEKDDLESKSYLTKMADDYLLKRHGSHDHRQQRLQECFVSLPQYLKVSPVAVN